MLDIAVISRGSHGSAAPVDRDVPADRVLLDARGEVAAAYGVFRTPSAVIVRADATIGTDLAQGLEAIRALLAHAVPPSAGSDDGDRSSHLLTITGAGGYPRVRNDSADRTEN